MPTRDDFTSTVDGAAAHAALFSDGGDVDVVTLADVPHDPPPPIRQLCTAKRVRDGVVTFCGLTEHPATVNHEPYPWTMPLEAYEEWVNDPPF